MAEPSGGSLRVRLPGYRLGIVGSRKLQGNPRAYDVIRRTLKHCEPTVVISGRSPGGGIDIMAVEVAQEMGIPFHEFPPQPKDNTYQARLDALFARNTQIAEASDVLLAITLPGGTSGTADTIKKAMRRGIPVIRVEIEAMSGN